MKFKLLKSLTLTFIILFSINIFITIFSYLNLLTSSAVKILNVFSIIISLFIGGYYIGNNSIKKGYLEGLKLAITFIIIILILSIILNIKFNIQNILLYFVYILSSILGSMLGINKKLIQEE